MKRLTKQGVIVYAVLSGITTVLAVQIYFSSGRNYSFWPVALLIYLAGLLMFYYWLDYQVDLLGKINEMVKAFTKGYLQESVSIARDDEIGELNANLRFMADRLNEYMGKTIQERDKNKTILASLVEGILAFNAEGRLISINQAGEKMLRVKRDDAEGRYFLEIVRSHQLAELFNKCLTEGQYNVLEEFQFSQLDKEYYRVYLAPIVNHFGKIQGAILVLWDVTKIRQLEQMRSEFVANVSHELRTPLTSIKGYVETLLDGALENRDLAERFLQIVYEESDRLNRLIGDLIELSALETRRSEIVKKELDSRQLTEKVQAVLLPVAGRKNIVIRTTVRPGAEKIYADQDMLEQLLLNLLDNAIKYSPSGETVSLEIAANLSGVSIKVADNGIGIPADSLPRLFERFYRVDKARSRLAGGTGLGLAIVKHIVERHRGQIQVESVEGKGSVFTVLLPGRPEI